MNIFVIVMKIHDFKQIVKYINKNKNELVTIIITCHIIDLALVLIINIHDKYCFAIITIIKKFL